MVDSGNKSKIGDFLVPAHFKSEWFLRPSSWGYVQDRESLRHAGFLWDMFLTACCKSPLLTIAGEVTVALKDPQRRLKELPAVLHATKPTGAFFSGKTPGEQLSLWLQWVIQFWPSLIIVQSTRASGTSKGTRKVRLQYSMPWFYPGDWCTNHLDFDLAQGYKIHL